MKFCVCDPDATFRHYGTLDSLHITDKLWERDKMHYPFFNREKELIIDVHLDEEKIIDQFKEEYGEFNNFCIAIPWKNKEFAKHLAELNYKWMFSTYCNTKDIFEAQMSYHPSQITIVENLAFDMQDIKRTIGETKIRAIANIGQCSKGTNKTINPITKFFIRPEDVRFYEGVVDTIELVGPPDRLSVIYEIYKEQSWQGPLDKIIQDVDIPLINSAFPPGFGEERLNCGKKCIYNKCHICQQSLLLGERFKDINIESTKEKEKFLWEWKPS